MAYALALSPKAVGQTETGVYLLLPVVYAGPDVPGSFQQVDVDVPANPGDSAVQLRNRLVSTIQAEATARGYTVAATAIILPAFQKGA